MSKSDAHLNNKSMNNLNVINKTTDVSLRLLLIIEVFYIFLSISNQANI